jgi:hypothetical protein
MTFLPHISTIAFFFLFLHTHIYHISHHIAFENSILYITLHINISSSSNSSNIYIFIIINLHYIYIYIHYDFTNFYLHKLFFSPPLLVIYVFFFSLDPNLFLFCLYNFFFWIRRIFNEQINQTPNKFFFMI